MSHIERTKTAEEGTEIENANASGRCDKATCSNRAVAVVYFEDTDTKKQMCDGHSGQAVQQHHARTGANRPSHTTSANDSLNRPQASDTVAWADESTIQAIWDDSQIDHFYTTAGGSTDDGNIHLFPCSGVRSAKSCQRKEKAVFPVGYAQPCRNCRYMWSHNDVADVKRVLARYVNDKEALNDE
jgi:hypothetical protein